MKGHLIPVKNNLLERKHYEQLGEAIWFYLWLLDKMTSVNNGIGLVLGGQPITYEMCKEDFGISVRQYRRWVESVRAAGYITTTRTPYGLTFHVNKAFKLFGRSATNGTSLKRDVPETERDVPESVIRSATNGTSNIRQDKDNTIDNTHTAGEDDLPEINEPDSLTSNRIKPSARRRDKSSPEINGVLAAFEQAMKVKLRRRENQRRMAHNLIREYGTDDVLAAIKAVALIKDERYAPQILDLQDLWEKWDKLAAFFRRKKADQDKKVAVIEEDDDA